LKNPSSTIIQGDALQALRDLPENSFQCSVSSPPYWQLRDYQVDGQIGLEPTAKEFNQSLVSVYSEVRRVLHPTGILWVNIGDSYSGGGNKRGKNSPISNKQASSQGCTGQLSDIPMMDGLPRKNLKGMPWRFAFAMQDDGWVLRDAMIWHKPNPMPTSQKDRCTSCYEYIFQFTQSPNYFFDMESIKEPISEKTLTANTTPVKKTSEGMGQDAGQNMNAWMEKNGGRYHASMKVPRNIRTWSTRGYKGAHFATYPIELPEFCIRASVPKAGVCAKCFTPYRRVIESTRRPTRPGENTKIKMPDGWDTGEGGHGSFHREGREKGEYRDTAEVGNRDPQRHVTETRTIRWDAGCNCDCGNARPAVLDPFSGVSTTGLACSRLGCDYVGIELNPEYAQMSRDRIQADLVKGFEPNEHAVNLDLGTAIDLEQENMTQFKY
jgi:DNA modification methylase